jgi:ribonuclease P protein component
MMPSCLGQARLGLIVGRRAEPKAVGRNYIKRIVRETFRLHQEQIGGEDVVVQLRGGAPGRGRPGRILIEELRGLFVALKA